MLNKEFDVKSFIWAIAAALLVAPVLLPAAAEAKSVKWSCVNIDPTNPSSYYCTPILRP
jgi:hypothetical protein